MGSCRRTEGEVFEPLVGRRVGEDALNVWPTAIETRTHHRRHVEIPPGVKLHDRMPVWPHHPPTSFDMRHDDVTEIHADFYRQIDLLEVSFVGVPLVKSLVEYSQARDSVI